MIWSKNRARVLGFGKGEGKKMAVTREKDSLGFGD